MQNNSLSRRQHIILASLLFGLLFGAGNLIFPIHLGQLSGPNWGGATIGFLISAVLLPLLSILAISMTESNSMYDLARPIGHRFAIFFLIVAHLSMGVLIASPRTATVTYSMGIQPFIPKQYDQISLFIFSLIFFGIAYALSYNQTKITDYIGKILNPIFILLIFILFFIAFLFKGDVNLLSVLPKMNQADGTLAGGFLQGYNTMDAISGLGFGVTIIAAIRQFGITNIKERSKSVAKVGILAMGLEAIIYIGLIILGAISLKYVGLSANGGTAFTQIMGHYTGTAGAAILAVMTFLACITTEVGLLTSLSQDWSKRFPRFSYRFFLTLATIGSFLIANLGLTNIITYSSILLVFLYPLAIALIILGLLRPQIGKSKMVYRTTIVLTIIPAILDAIHNFPPALANVDFIKAIDTFATQYIPLFSMGLDFIPFTLVGLIVSFIVYKATNKRETSLND